MNNIRSIQEESQKQALDLLVIAFLLLFTVVMFMQFGFPNFKNTGIGETKPPYSSIFGQ